MIDLSEPAPRKRVAVGKITAGVAGIFLAGQLNSFSNRLSSLEKDNAVIMYVIKLKFGISKNDFADRKLPPGEAPSPFLSQFGPPLPSPTDMPSSFWDRVKGRFYGNGENK